MHKIKIIHNGQTKTVSAESGTPLSALLIHNNISAEHPCGGKGLCKKCSVIVDGKEELSCRYIINSDISVVIPEKSDILSETGAQESNTLTENVALCLDIGTTTLALALVSLDENEIIKTITTSNPQRIFGSDVISRIDYCTKNGATPLQSVLLDAVNQMIADLLGEYGLSVVENLYVAGNTTMEHLFFGIDCSSMGQSPYTPAFTESKRLDASEVGIKGAREVISLPSISAFIGADIVAGMNYIAPLKKGKYDLLVDLGTNAEVVLCNQDSILCTTAAAGPCFEGSNISCGMSATEGAIYSYSPDGTYSVIGNDAPNGICATGLIDIIAALLKNEVIDETGYMECEQFEVSEDVFMSAEDIRAFQLAKSAVYSAIMCLLKLADISFDDVDKMYVSGGFSAKMDIDNAVYIGLLPKELKDKFSPMNNSSLLGTAKYICQNNDLDTFTDRAKYVDLSANPLFSELFFENMMFLDD